VNKTEIQDLIIKSFDNTLSNPEQDRLNNWLLESPEHELEFAEHIDKLKNKGGIALSKKIDVERALSVIKKQIKKAERKQRMRVYFKYAAVLVPFLCLFGYLSHNFLSNTSLDMDTAKAVVFKEVSSGYGEHTKIVLPDSSVVWLNSGSTLRYPTSFSAMAERKVELNGEAFFEVTKNKNKSFIVDTKKVDVKVYGTAFNVSSYNDYNSMTVALVEGKVSIIEEANAAQKELVMLKPSDVIEFNALNKDIKRSIDLNMEKYYAWRNGYLMFSATPLTKVIERLEKWYHVKIQVSNDALKAYRFTATFQEESLENILDLLCMSSRMEYKIVSNNHSKNGLEAVKEIVLNEKK